MLEFGMEHSSLWSGFIIGTWYSSYLLILWVLVFLLACLADLYCFGIAYGIVLWLEPFKRESTIWSSRICLPNDYLRLLTFGWSHIFNLSLGASLMLIIFYCLDSGFQWFVHAFDCLSSFTSFACGGLNGLTRNWSKWKRNIIQQTYISCDDKQFMALIRLNLDLTSIWFILDFFSLILFYFLFLL